MSNRVLIVDDDPSFNKMLTAFLIRNGFNIISAFSSRSALDALNKGQFDLVLTDFKLPDMDGLSLITKIKTQKSKLPIILMTSYQDIRTAVKSIQLGAYEFVTKPLNPDELLLLIKKAISSELPSTQKKERKNEDTDFISGTSEEDQELLAHIKLVAPTKMSVLILGESGTGKEYTARLLHKQSKRSSKAFYAIDCGALSKELALSELFGHKKGAFTGALEEKKGVFELANNGTLFLDEVGNLSYEVQVQLLRVLQEKRIRPVGGSEEIPVDVRLISATNEEIKDNDFRLDLYHRLNEFTLKLSPIRNRQGDLERFAKHFVELAAGELGSETPTLSDEVLDFIKSYQWPGNLRELRNIMRGAVLLSGGKIVQLRHLPNQVRQQENAPVKPKKDKHAEQDLKRLQEETERELIVRVLKATKYNKSKTAMQLNIDRKTLYRKLKKYAIDH
ncbi:MAG: sigma-54 dependent transcriptional regulator [Bacteroidota bacterium]